MKTKNSIKYLLILTAILFGSNMGFSQAKKVETINIKTSAVCGMCKDRIEQGLAYGKGIKDVSLDVDTKIATVKYSPSKTTADDIRKTISKLGYNADTIACDKKAYEKLPACCKKDAKQH